ncbi:MAG: AAA+ family ATPase [Desulfobacterium sp.]|nr:AAA+ family ATPase [Desulfobacterium sp.]
MMDRFAENNIKQWFEKSHRKPLVLRGARQVGKSTLVRQFARKNNLHLIEINLERHLYLDTIFKTLDLNHIIREIEAIAGLKIQKPDALLFLDEIQATPHALQALRYFYEDKPELPVIAAGSLLEFTLSRHSFSMPVGRIEYYHLWPMSFKEFLHALEPSLAEYLSTCTLETGIPVAAHQKLLKRFREFLFTGGMPEVVDVYRQTGSVADMAQIQRSIVDTYQDDFSKYARQKELAIMQMVFRHIPRTIGRKIKYSNISKEQKSREVKAAIDLLTKARICHKVFHSHCSGVPLYADINENTYKLIFMDVGIANHICGNDWIAIQSLPDNKLVNEGAIAEQFIGQHLVLLRNDSPGLCYWLREGRSSNAEVDYVFSHGNLVLPVEVKSGKEGSLKSLQQFVLNKKTKLAVRFDLNMPGLQNLSYNANIGGKNKPVEFTLLSLPLYMVEELPRLIEQIRSEKTDSRANFKTIPALESGFSPRPELPGRF